MEEDFHPQPLFGQTFPLRDGVRVRLRLPHPGDAEAIDELISRQDRDQEVHDLVAETLVHFDPRQRYVICATALIDSAVRLLGVGAIDLGEPFRSPDVLVVDPELGEEVGPLLVNALTRVAEASARAA